MKIYNLLNPGKKFISKQTNDTHVVDSVDFYDEVVLVFTKDKKYIKIDDVCINEFDSSDCDVLEPVFNYIRGGSPEDFLNNFKKYSDEVLKELIEKNKLTKKKTIKEYLLSPLSNLFPTFFHPSTSKG